MNVGVVVRLAFLGISVKVDQVRRREMKGWVAQRFLQHENHLEVSPLDSEKRVAHPI